MAQGSAPVPHSRRSFPRTNLSERAGAVLRPRFAEDAEYSTVSTQCGNHSANSSYFFFLYFRFGNGPRVRERGRERESYVSICFLLQLVVVLVYTTVTGQEREKLIQKSSSTRRTGWGVAAAHMGTETLRTIIILTTGSPDLQAFPIPARGLKKSIRAHHPSPTRAREMRASLPVFPPPPPSPPRDGHLWW